MKMDGMNRHWRKHKMHINLSLKTRREETTFERPRSIYENTKLGLALYRGQWRISCEHGTESSASINGREFLDDISDCQLLNKDAGP
jgi:hypothetical protein